MYVEKFGKKFLPNKYLPRSYEYVSGEKFPITEKYMYKECSYSQLSLTLYISASPFLCLMPLTCC